MKSDFIQPLLDWYKENHRDLPWRRTKDAYAVWVSEIMLQQTRVAAAIPYYERFMAELPTVSHLAQVDDERLHKLWEGLGYYSRASNMKKAARMVMDQCDGRMPDSYEPLLALPGIGAYTAGAVASIAYGVPVPAVDGNVLRVFARMNDDPADIADPAVKEQVRATILLFFSERKEAKENGIVRYADRDNTKLNDSATEKIVAKENSIVRCTDRGNTSPCNSAAEQKKAKENGIIRYTSLTPPARQDPGAFNAALMELGAVVCLPTGRPHCESCPVKAFCMGFASGRAGELPVRKTKKARRTEEKTVFALLGPNGLYYGYRRPENGLLAGLWQLPELPGIVPDKEMTEQLGRWGIHLAGPLLVYRRKQIFTHVEWLMQVCAATVSLEALPDRWTELDEQKALPSAYRVCLP